MNNFSDKYFVLVLCSFCLEQFHLFQNYPEQASSLTTVLDKEPDSTVSDNSTNREAASEELLQLSAAVSEHWAGPTYLSLDQLGEEN